MALSSHFFIEQGAFTSNTLEQSFGPQSSSLFNLTTQFTITANKKAYSICKGVLLLQPQTGNNDKVNLILRPFKQPFPGLDIKYFIYRGLKKSDFFTGNLIKTADSTTSDFINKINADFISFYTPLPTTPNGTPIQQPPFTAAFIGYNESVVDTTLLSSFFFKESQFVEANSVFIETQDSAFELPMIDEGNFLGNFAIGQCGIDVVLNYGDYKHDFDNGEFIFNLNYARKPFATIEIIATETNVQKKLKREQITQFIDIAAFYGLYFKGGEIKITNASAVVATKKEQLIYNEILTPFANKNKWYFYIQSDRTRSYNYYNNYVLAQDNSNNLKIGTTEATLANDYYKHQDWPLLIVSTSQAATPQNVNNLFLKLVTDNSINTMLYCHVGTLANEQQNNFCDTDFLSQPPDVDGNYSNLTTTLHFTNPSSNGEMIAGLTIVIYQGLKYLYKSGTTTNENNEIVNVFATPNFFDDVFDLIKSQPLLKLNADSEFSKMTSQKLNLINHYYDKKQQGISAVQTLTVNDIIETGIEATPTLARVTYTTETINLKANAVSPLGSITTDTKTSVSAGGTIAKSKTYTLPDTYYYSLQLFTDSTQTITGLKLKTYDGSTPTKIILGLTALENQVVKDIITVNPTIKNPRLFLIDLFDDGNELLSPENIKYQKYKVALVAEKMDGSLELFLPATDIMVFSLDRKFHFSKGYSEFVKEVELSDSFLIINLDLD